MVRYIMTHVPRLISYPAPEVEEKLEFHNRWLEVVGEYGQVRVSGVQRAGLHQLPAKQMPGITAV